MADLNLSSLELISTLRKVAKNGSPSSQDYNDFQSETLSDAALVVSFINDTLLPMLNALPSTAATGLEGQTLWSDTADVTSLFFDSQASLPLTVGDSLRLLRAMLVTDEQKLSDLGVEVTSLKTQLASTNQNDVAQALQNFSQSLQELTTSVNINTGEISLQGQELGEFRTDRKSVTITASSTESNDLDWTFPFPSNDYSVSVSLDDPDGFLRLLSWKKKGAGVGVTVVIQNTDASNHTADINAIAKAD